jgi:hypothetical protein
VLLLELLPVEGRDLIHLDAELFLIGLNKRSDFQASDVGCLIDIFLIGLVLNQLKSGGASTLLVYFIWCLYFFNRHLYFDRSWQLCIQRFLRWIDQATFSIPL